MTPTDLRGEVAPGTVVVVTGGARGIGAELARHLATQGAAVVTADVVAAGGETGDLDITHVQADVSDEASWRDLVAVTLDRHGRIDALVNNAAIYQGLGGKRAFTDISVDEWDRVMAVNTRGVWLGMRAVHPVMRAQGRGRVVNIASSTVHMGVPYFAHYTASKGAVIALTRSVAREVGADGITVNAVAPGLVETEATRSLNDPDYLAASAGRRAVPRAMEPGDLAPVVSFLCSEGSGFLTGQTLVVDGGVTFS
ncbi:SDR family oxidoreductase [Modestobacter sp. VKM Ac-2986]|uniref:SDR family NAD(P)-dependent oxidoreductase n=1 Tax=Modestobacter sp. VKM Ac-2986 TaxID=3004140 RepID=UPI0022AB97A0|nr:SDR family oxidoreductase [Modestobacter sp. VKM Ac-2986]MCZ2829279.1 SDR family oxidoreductase [Modestobacter sp. VKM Ac-2986]